MAEPDVERLRLLHGRSTAVWTGNGLHVVGASHWLALSGARHVDYNLALFHGSGGEYALAADLDRITSARRPAIIALAGACRTTSLLADAGWAPVGGAPLMALECGTTDEGGALDAGTRLEDTVRPLLEDEVPLARALVAEVFGLTPDVAELAVAGPPPPAVDRTVWGCFERNRLVSTLIAVRVEDAVVIWSMATAADQRRRGRGQALLAAVIATAGRKGARICLLHASVAGEPLYAAAGFSVVERWDFWSRRRWVLAAT